MLKLGFDRQATAAWLFPQHSLLFGSLLLFLSGAFLLPPFLWGVVLYVAVFPSLIFEWNKGERPNLLSPWYLTAFVLLAWAAVTLMWGENPGGGRVFKFVSASILVTGYLIALAKAYCRDKAFMQRVGTLMILAGTINATLSCLYYLLPLGLHVDTRLHGFAITRHPILGSLIIGIVCLFALDRVIRENKHKAFYAFSFMIGLLFIFLSNSRGPLVSVTAAILVLLISAKQKQRAYVLSACALSIVASLPVAYLVFDLTPMDLLAKLLVRGLSHRPDIWAFSLHRVEGHLWTGLGPAAYLNMFVGSSEIPFPHNLFVSTVFYYGLIGLALFLGVLGFVGYWIMMNWRKNPETPLITALIVLLLFGGLTDLAQLAVIPGPLWFILWLPVGVIFAQMKDCKSRR